ncbi:MAG: hypothetical protein WBD09_03910 [Halobacteriota archaeon]
MVGGRAYKLEFGYTGVVFSKNPIPYFSNGGVPVLADILPFASQKGFIF